MISVLEITTKPGKVDEFIREFDEIGVAKLAQSATQAGKVVVLTPIDSSKVLVMTEWDSTEDYRVWLTHPDRDSLGPRLDHLIEGTQSFLYHGVSLSA